MPTCDPFITYAESIYNDYTGQILWWVGILISSQIWLILYESLRSALTYSRWEQECIQYLNSYLSMCIYILCLFIDFHGYWLSILFIKKKFLSIYQAQYFIITVGLSFLGSPLRFSKFSASPTLTNMCKPIPHLPSFSISCWISCSHVLFRITRSHGLKSTVWFVYTVSFVIRVTMKPPFPYSTLGVIGIIYSKVSHRRVWWE